MSDLPLTLTCADYARVMPLAAGTIKPAGIALTMILGQSGKWTGRAEMLRRAVQDPACHGGEWSMAQYLYRVEKGDKSFVGLPIFPLRNFTARDIYIRKAGPIQTAADLAGKRVGMYSYTASGSIWYRHLLRHLGLDPAALQWWIGDIDTPWSATKMDLTLPAGINAPPPGRSLSDMLIAGELDAILSPPRPEKFHPENGPIARLFPDFRPIEETYFRATGAFPPQHLIVLRRAVWDAHPWIGRALTDAFIACETEFTAGLRGFPYATPWMEEDLANTHAVMGPDFHPYGFPATRAQIDMFTAEAHRSVLTARRITPEEYFADFLAAA